MKLKEERARGELSLEVGRLQLETRFLADEMADAEHALAVAEASRRSMPDLAGAMDRMEEAEAKAREAAKKLKEYEKVVEKTEKGNKNLRRRAETAKCDGGVENGPAGKGHEAVASGCRPVRDHVDQGFATTQDHRILPYFGAPRRALFLRQRDYRIALLRLHNHTKFRDMTVDFLRATRKG